MVLQELRMLTLTKLCAVTAFFGSLHGCGSHKDYYQSACNTGHDFKHVSFTQLVDSINYFDNQYVEVTGVYQQGSGESALFNANATGKQAMKKALWVEFSPECPLYLDGTHIGFFDYDHNDGKLTPADNKTITIRGVVNIHYKRKPGLYKGQLDHISYVRLN